MVFGVTTNLLHRPRGEAPQYREGVLSTVDLSGQSTTRTKSGFWGLLWAALKGGSIEGQ
jgi:hypothetical protein